MGGVATGISFTAQMPGMVPEFEERQAARHCGYTWRTWSELARGERIDGVADYRLTRMVELHSNDAHLADSRAKQRRPRGR